jgi:hypothetical protein
VQGVAAPAPSARNAPGPSGAQENEAGSAAKASRPRRNPKEEAEKLPLVKRAVEVLGATIQRVDDNFGSPVDSDSAARKNGVDRPDGPEQEP